MRRKRRESLLGQATPKDTAARLLWRDNAFFAEVFILEALKICRRRIVRASAYTAATIYKWQIFMTASITNVLSGKISSPLNR